MSLDHLLDKKVARERLGAVNGASSGSDAATAAAGSSSKPVTKQGATEDKLVANLGPRLCWLCGQASLLRFRLPGFIHLCFACFRVSYFTLILPVINTQARRKSDADFLKLMYTIEGETTTSTSSLGDESLNSMYGEVFDPQRASFVMSSSMIRQRREEELRGASSGATGSATSVPSFWNCPRCTFLNSAPVRECEACGFIDPGAVVCPVCDARCSIGMVDTSSSSAPPAKKCRNGKPHCLWNCRECGRLNTLDGDRCSSCQQLRYWACSQCTALHHMARDEDGLRYCTTCGAYNTPDDILVGQAKIDRETKYAELVTAQKDAERRRSDSGKDREHLNADLKIAAGGDAAVVGDGEIVFGVNDAHTLEERARQKQIECNEQRLLSRLRRLNISRNVQKTDGNCLFSALANQLFGQPKLHLFVRSLVTAYMSNHPEDYSILFDGDGEWRAYLAAMREQGTWGDELCLNAAARCFRVNIHVITSDAERWHIVFQYDKLTQFAPVHSDQAAMGNVSLGNGEKPLSAVRSKSTAVPPPPKSESLSLFLAYLAPVHYDDITPFPVSNLLIAEFLSRELSTRLKRRSAACLDSAGNKTISLANTSSAPALISRSNGSMADASTFPRALSLLGEQRPLDAAGVLTPSSHSVSKSTLESLNMPGAPTRLDSRSRMPSRKQSSNR